MGERSFSASPEISNIRASRTKPTHIEIKAVTEHIEEKKLPNGEIEEDIDVLVFWAEHTTRMRPVHANSHRMTF